jgi:hypothetical protein
VADEDRPRHAELGEQFVDHFQLPVERHVAAVE